MAAKEKAKGAVKTQSRRWRFILAALAVVIIVAALVAGFRFTSGFLFGDNPHFMLKRVTVTSTGWWNGRSSRVREVLGLSDSVNLFQIDLKKFREILEDQPSIRQASVYRILPDTLAVEVVERIPRAALFDSQSRWVIDETGIVMDRETCIGAERNLPVIMGLDRKRRVEAGVEMPELQPALNLITLVNTEFTDFRITAISIRSQDQLTFIVFYQNEEQSYKVFMPVTKDLREMMFCLRSTIAKAIRLGDYRRSVNLNFKGQAVLR